MNVRAASLRDLSQLERIYQNAGSQLSEQEPPAARLWSLLSQTLRALVPLAGETLIYVGESDAGVIGFIQATAHPSAPVLQVVNLCVVDGENPERVAPPLVQHLTNRALERRVHRLFVRLPQPDPLTPIFRLQGFRQYATEFVLYSESPRPAGPGAPAGIRSARGGDLRRLYHLYRKVTPLGVAQLEAPSYGEWRALRRRSTGGEELVVDRVELTAWTRVERGTGAAPSTLSFLVLPEAPLPEEMADFALGLLEAGQPAWSSLRHYDSLMIDALRGRGFSSLVTQSLLVKELVVRVPVREKGLVPSFG
ncbi:MAG TPA: hypothetical protein VK131_08985 [Candidatus Acidoferrales bacterium]|nr:hypothetical protein [Candidatus Acidoferrales bacterium]